MKRPKFDLNSVAKIIKNQRLKKLDVDEMLTKKLTIGVTGFSRSGKTVFIGALAQALITASAWSKRKGQGPLAQFGPVEKGIFRSAQIRNDVNVHLPQFPFLKVRKSLVSKDTAWPVPTEGVSHLTLDLDYKPQGAIKIRNKVRIELVDYPGEWLVDLPMLKLTYADWSEQMLLLAKGSLRSAWSLPFFGEIDSVANDQSFDDELATQLSEVWADYLQKASGHGLTLNQPGRLLRPDALRNSPVLRFAPLPDTLRATGLGQGMEQRFEDYKKKVIKPFYRDHFSKIDRQVVLIDALAALEKGEDVFNEMTTSLKNVLGSFHYGKGNLLSWLKGVKITHLLFAATKADHVTRGDRANLEELVGRMLMLVDEHNQVRSNAAHYEVMAIASVQATEDRMTTNTPKREVLYGKPANDESAAQWDPGGLPLDMPPDWNALHFQFFKFAPRDMPDALSEGFPAINLGKALDFLIGEELQ
jgi:uncharacterized protein